MRSETGVTLTLLAVLALSGCQYDPHTREYPASETTPKPRVQDLSGTYFPTPEAQAFIKNQGHYPSAKTFIVLSRNGTFRFSNVPDCWHTESGDSHGKFDSGSGRWTIENYQEWWDVGLNFTNTTGFHSEKLPNGLTTGIQLIGQKPPYRLHLTVGDPDGGKALDFERQKPKS